MGRLLAWVLLLACCTLAPSAHGQQGEKATKVLLYKDRVAAQWDTVNCVKNVFKLDPLVVLRGEIPLYYERALSSRASAELGLGITTRNYLGGVAGEVSDNFSAGVRIVKKPAIHAGFRYYLADDLEPQGSYLQLSFAYLDHSRDITLRDSTGQFTGQVLRDRKVYNDVRFYFGYQRLASTSNWLFDAYGGLGFRSRTFSSVKESINLATRAWSYAMEDRHDNIPVLFVGLKVGYGF